MEWELSLLLAEICPDVDVLGIDFEHAAIDEANACASQRGIKNINFRQGSALQLPVEDRQFDAVVCQTLLSHITEPKTALHEMLRVLKPGGKLMIAEWGNSGTIQYCDYPGKEDSPSKNEERVRLERIYELGRKAKGYSQEAIGEQIPRWLKELGCHGIEIRINDQIGALTPPYRSPEDDAMREYVEFNLTTRATPTADQIARFRELMIAGGGTEADIEVLQQVFLPRQIAQSSSKRFVKVNSTWWAPKE